MITVYQYITVTDYVCKYMLANYVNMGGYESMVKDYVNEL